MPILLLSLALFACREPEDTADTASPVGTVELSDADNYSYDATIEVTAVPLAAHTNVHFTWADLTRDMYAQDLDLAAVQQVDVLNFLGDQDLFLEHLANDNIQASELALYAHCEPTSPGCWLDDFMMGATHPLDLSEYFLEGTGSWLLALSLREVPGYAAALFIEPQAASEVTAAAITDSSSRFLVTTDLEQATAVTVPNAGTTLDWAGLTVDGAGNSLALYRLDKATLAWFSGGLTVPAATPHQLSESADALYELDIAGRTALTLAELVDAAGSSADLTTHADGAWVLALRCTTCTSRMPEFLTVLAPAL